MQKIDEVAFKLYDEQLASSIAYVLAVSHGDKNTRSLVRKRNRRQHSATLHAGR
jgi:hypothetical protein